MPAHVVVFRVPDSFDLAAIPADNFLYLTKLELHAPTPANPGGDKFLHSHWQSQAGYGSEESTFRARLGAAISASNPQPPASTLEKDWPSKTSWPRWLGRAAVVFLLGSTTLSLKSCYEQIETVENLTDKVKEYQSQLNVHLIPPKKVVLASNNDQQEIAVEIHNFSGANSPEVVFESAHMLHVADGAKTAVKQPGVFQFPKIDKGDFKTLKIDCPKLAAGKYELHLKVKATGKVHSESRQLVIPAEVWARWDERRRPDTAHDRAMQDKRYCESRWELLPGDDFNDWHVQAKLRGADQVRFLGVVCEVAVPEKARHEEDVAWVRWHIKHLKKLEPIPFSLILVSDIDRTPEQWAAIQDKIKINNGPVPAK